MRNQAFCALTRRCNVSDCDSDSDSEAMVLETGQQDPPGLLHGPPLHVVVQALGLLQPGPQHGRGVVHIVVRRCPGKKQDNCK